MRPLRKNSAIKKSNLKLVKDSDDVFHNLMEGIIGLNTNNKKDAMKLIDKAIKDFDTMQSNTCSSIAERELSFLRKIMG